MIYFLILLPKKETAICSQDRRTGDTSARLVALSSLAELTPSWDDLLNLGVPTSEEPSSALLLRTMVPLEKISDASSFDTSDVLFAWCQGKATPHSVQALASRQSIDAWQYHSRTNWQSLHKMKGFNHMKSHQLVPEQAKHLTMVSEMDAL
jgi:hypothetical protein